MATNPTEAAPPQIPATVQQAALAELDATLARANAVQVTNVDEYASAVQVLSQIAAMKTRRTNERLDITRKMDAAKSAVMDFFANTFITPLDRIDGIIRGKVKAYDAEQKRIADERRKAAEAEAARLRAETERKAREEAQRAQLKAKAEREEAERQRQEADRARKQEEEARAKGDADMARAAAATARQLDAAAAKSEQKAERISETGAARAQSLTEQAAAIVAPVVLTEQTKVPGKAKRTVWRHRITDAAKIDRKFMSPDESKIGATVRALKKDAVDVVGGIEVWEEDDISIKAAKS